MKKIFCAPFIIFILVVSNYGKAANQKKNDADLSKLVRSQSERITALEADIAVMKKELSDDGIKSKVSKEISEAISEKKKELQTLFEQQQKSLNDKIKQAKSTENELDKKIREIQAETLPKKVFMFAFYIVGLLGLITSFIWMICLLLSFFLIPPPPPNQTLGSRRKSLSTKIHEFGRTPLAILNSSGIKGKKQGQ